MSDDQARQKWQGYGNPFSPAALALIGTIAIMSFAAVTTLSAWSPELTDKNRAGAHAYSEAALGYKALQDVLAARGEAVSVSRNPLTAPGESLIILAPPTETTGEALDDYLDNYGRPALFLLPKWQGTADEAKPRWFGETEFIPVPSVRRLAEKIVPGTKVKRIPLPDTLSFAGATFTPNLSSDLQVLTEHGLTSLIDTQNGTLLAYDGERDIFILSDPDIFSTHGLADFETLRLALSIVASAKRDPGASIVFDAGLNGFAMSNNLLRILLRPPFLGASLTAIAALLLLGWVASIRFGAPAAEQRAHALGKAALTDATAGLFTMARRERRMAPDYLAVQRRAVARQLALPSSLTSEEMAELLDRMTPAQIPHLYSDMARLLAMPAASREDLVHKARQLHRWRQEILNEHK